MNRKILSLLLALVMALTVPIALAEKTAEQDWGAEDYRIRADYRTELADSYEGKTVILHSNDVHGELLGYAYIAGLRDLFIDRGADVLLVDSGDFSQGNIYVSSSKGLAAIEMMNAAAYDVVTLGNHEFDFGYDQLMDNLKQASFAAICANVTLNDADNMTILAPAHVTETQHGLKLGFVGVETPETRTKVNPGLIANLTFAVHEDMQKLTQAAVDSIREECDLVFGLFHLGVENDAKPDGNRSIDLLDKVTGIDFTLDAHGHTQMTEGQHGERIQSTGTKFANVGVVVIDNENKTIEDHFLIPTHIHSPLYTFNYINQAVKEKAEEIIQKVDQEFGASFATTDVTLNGERADNRSVETNMGDLITDAIIWFVNKDGGIQLANPSLIVSIVNGGAIRATIQPGEISRKDIKSVLPYGNTVAVIYVTGEELLEALEASTFCTPETTGGYPQTSGFEWTIDTTKPYDQGTLYVLDGKESTYYAPASINRVSITAVNGQPFDPKTTYAVVTNDFLAAGGDTYNVFGRSITRFDTGVPLDEAVVAYINEVLDGRITKEAYGSPRNSVTQIK